MTIRDTTVTKLQQLPESLLQEVSDFIDFVMHNHLAKTAGSPLNEDPVEAWSRWFEVVDRLEVTTAERTTDYQQLLLNKYRQQGLEL